MRWEKSRPSNFEKLVARFLDLSLARPKRIPRKWREYTHDYLHQVVHRKSGAMIPFPRYDTARDKTPLQRRGLQIIINCVASRKQLAMTSKLRLSSQSCLIISLRTEFLRERSIIIDEKEQQMIWRGRNIENDSCFDAYTIRELDQTRRVLDSNER